MNILLSTAILRKMASPSLVNTYTVLGWKALDGDEVELAIGGTDDISGDFVEFEKK